MKHNESSGGRRRRVAVIGGCDTGRIPATALSALSDLDDCFEPLFFRHARPRGPIGKQSFPFAVTDARPLPPSRQRFVTALERVSGRVAPLPRRQLLEWTETARAAGVQLVHAFSLRAGLQGRSFAQALGVPLLVFLDARGGLDTRGGASRWRGFVGRRALRRVFESAQIRANSQGLADRLLDLGANPARTGVFYWNASLEGCPFQERPGVARRIACGEPLHFLQLAPFEESAGHRYTIEAFRLFLGVYPTSELVLLGRGRLQARCMAQVRRMGIADKVRIGTDADPEAVAERVSEADVLLHHELVSAQDGPQDAPEAILRAMATGLPVVTTLDSAVSEFVSEGQNGARVPARDIEIYAARLRDVLGWGPEKGRLARERVLESFDPRRQAVALGELYAALVAAPASS